MNPTMKFSSRRGLNLLIIFCLVLIFCDICQSSPTNYYLSGRRFDKKYCGTDLTATLQILCDGRYNLMIYKKSDLEYKLPGRPLEDPHIQLKYEGIVETDGSKRQRRSIIEECCKYPCAYKTLEQYCQRDNEPSGKTT